jgi:hypothetical protein
MSTPVSPQIPAFESSQVTDLYLDLLKRSLTNTVFHREPDVNDDPARYVAGAISHYQRSEAVSMLPLVRFDNMTFCIRNILQNGVPGDFIEAGVWRGGAVIFMRALLKVYGVEDRCVWAADSFEGLPKPDAEKFPREAKSYDSAAMTKYYDHLAAGLDLVRRNFEAYSMLDDRVKFLKGWFKDTLPPAPIERLALVRIDGDYYESTMDSLVNLYDKLSPGGYVIVDDYGEDHWTYCRQAVDDCRQSRGIKDPIIPVDKPCIYWQRGS